MHYHLHHELISKDSHGDETATLCKSCLDDISKKKIPKFSVAAGVDFGVPSRIALPSLSLAEQDVIAQGRL